MNLTDARLAQAGCDKLETALLSFFEAFRKIYIGDQVQKTSKVYRRLSEVLGLNDEAMVLSVIIRKVCACNLIMVPITNARIAFAYLELPYEVCKLQFFTTWMG